MTVSFSRSKKGFGAPLEEKNELRKNLSTFFLTSMVRFEAHRMTGV